MDRARFTTTGVAKGGAAIARDDDGRVVFIRGALPGEVVTADVVETRRDFATADVHDVVDPSPWRIAPPCPEVAAGCGGCDWQHVSPDGQRALKIDIVADALARLARFDAHPPIGFVPLPGVGYRSTVRGLVRDGRFAFRRRSSNDPVDVASCLVAHPLLDELIRDGEFGRAREVTLRCGVRTGERLVIASPSAKGVKVPDDVAVVGLDRLRRGEASSFHEEVLGVRFRISARSFFQARADGADALVAAVADELVGLAPAGRAVDLYAGVGLFAATALAAWPEVVAVEHNASAVGDCRVNVPRARTVRADVGEWRPDAASVVVADPSREGLGRLAAEKVASASAARVVLVSCDPAAFARDAALLRGYGYELSALRIVDLFPQTSHIEVVSRFDRH